MTNVTIEETAELRGTIKAPPSKSYTHRCVIAASLSEGRSQIHSPLFCDDTLATIKACTLFGAGIKQVDDGLEVFGSIELKAPMNEINCDESGSTIRFLTPVAAIVKGVTILTGSPSLRKRPISPLLVALEQLGVHCSSKGGFPPITIFNGGIRGGKASLAGDVSSQFVTGLLLACPLAQSSAQIYLTTPLESKPYVELTLDIIRRHGIQVNTSPDLRRFEIPEKQRYLPRDHHVPGDISSAAFLLAAAVMTNSHIKVENLSLDQPDREILEILKRMGVEVEFSGKSVEVSGGELKGIEIDAKDTPDLVPVCAALASLAKGTTKIHGARRLRLKESDRLSSLPSELRKMGVKIEEDEDGLTINGPCILKGTTVRSHNDHRIAMACAIAALKAEGRTHLIDAESVNKSYPNFFDDLRKLGGKVHIS